MSPSSSYISSEYHDSISYSFCTKVMQTKGVNQVHHEWNRCHNKLWPHSMNMEKCMNTNLYLQILMKTVIFFPICKVTSYLYCKWIICIFSSTLTRNWRLDNPFVRPSEMMLCLTTDGVFILHHNIQHHLSQSEGWIFVYCWLHALALFDITQHLSDVISSVGSIR